jgi:hypothetical protein
VEERGTVARDGVVGRTLLEQGVPGAGEDIPVPVAVDDMLGTRVGRLAPALRRLLLAIALSADPRADELVAMAGESAVEEAVDAGLLVVDGVRARATHPLLAAVARQRTRPRELREVHLALAGAVSDGELRALHRALATIRPDAELAKVPVGRSPGSVRARGA